MNKGKEVPRYPSSLPSYLLSLLERPTHQLRQDDRSRESGGNDSGSNAGTATLKDNSTEKPSDGTNATRFLGAPQFNMNMDVRKWNWPGYLTFGARKASSPIHKPLDPTLEVSATKPDLAPGAYDSTESQVAVDTTTEAEKNSTAHIRSESRVSVVDSVALEDALTSDSVTVSSLANTRPSSPTPLLDLIPIEDGHNGDGNELLKGVLANDFLVKEQKGDVHPPEEDGTQVRAAVPNGDTVESLEDTEVDLKQTETTAPQNDDTPSPPRLTFSQVTVYLPNPEEGSAQRRRIHFIKASTILST